MGEAEKKAAYKKDKRDKARLAKKERKKAAMGKKVARNVLEQMIFPKIVQCSAIDLKLNTQVSDDDAWAYAMGSGDVRCIRTGCVLGGCHSSSACSHGFRRELDPIDAMHYVGDIGTQREEPRSQVVL